VQAKCKVQVARVSECLSTLSVVACEQSIIARSFVSHLRNDNAMASLVVFPSVTAWPSWLIACVPPPSWSMPALIPTAAASCANSTYKRSPVAAECEYVHLSVVTDER
jgi:hypothetical protein